MRARGRGIRQGAAALVVVPLIIAFGLVAAGPAGGSARLDGTRFDDPEGAYRMTIPRSGWKAAHGAIASGIELWFVAPRKDGFTPNVNVITQTIPARTTLEAYLKASIANAPRLLTGFASVRSRIAVERGVRLGVWEYRSRERGRGFRHLGVFAIEGTRAIVVTLSVPQARYTTLRDATLPYLLTLEPLRRA